MWVDEEMCERMDEEVGGWIVMKHERVFKYLLLGMALSIVL